MKSELSVPSTNLCIWHPLIYFPRHALYSKNKFIDFKNFLDSDY